MRVAIKTRKLVWFFCVFHVTLNIGDGIMEELIDKVIGNFDFKKVHKVMLITNWCWYNEYSEHLEVPSIGDLILCAQRLLQDVSKRDVGCSLGTGGFTATKIFDDDMKEGLKLEFVLESYGCYLNEKERRNGRGTGIGK